jgi:GH25 family lysozyme M1 (1,4-beta-N-acetylmuramidase)
MTYTTRVDGLDVSHYQGTIDWPTVRTHIAGPGLAAWKVSQGATTIDATNTTNRQATSKAGFRWRLGYHWLVPYVNPILQADWFLNHHTNLQPGEGVILDAEQAGITEPMVLAWCEHVETVTARPVAVYTGIYVAGGSIWYSTRVFNGQRARWLAAYEPESMVRAAAQPYGFDVWQGDGGATGTFPGVATGVDLNMVENPIILDLACAITATPQPTQEEDSMDIVTNSETFLTSAPYVAKFVVKADGSLRHITYTEWLARGSLPGNPLTTAQILELGAS